MCRLLKKKDGAFFGDHRIFYHNESELTRRFTTIENVLMTQGTDLKFIIYRSVAIIVASSSSIFEASTQISFHSIIGLISKIFLSIPRS